MIKNKKGMTLGDLYPAILTIVLIGIVLGIGLFIMSEVRTNVAIDYTGADTLAEMNGTLGLRTNVTTLSDSTNDNYKLGAVVAINGTGAGTLTNYTFTEAGVISWGANLVAESDAGATANISSTYTYDSPGSGEAAMQDVLEGTDDFAAWIAIIVVVIAAAVVLGVVLSSFGREPGV